MKTEFKHNYKEFSDDAVIRRVNKMVSIREQLITEGVEKLHVKISYGNRKTGALVPSVSGIPVADCPNCGICRAGCYDVRNVCFQGTVQRARANNSAILRTDPDRYFIELEKSVKFLTFFRFHVGGDLLSRSHFLRVVKLAENCPNCQILVFTKLYGVINHYLDEGGTIPGNLHVIFSDWRGAEFSNRHNLPVSSPMWKKDETIETGPHCTEKTVICPGSCEECAAIGGGCWGLKNGETVLFEAH